MLTIFVTIRWPGNQRLPNRLALGTKPLINSSKNLFSIFSCLIKPCYIFSSFFRYRGFLWVLQYHAYRARHTNVILLPEFVFSLLSEYPIRIFFRSSRKKKLQHPLRRPFLFFRSCVHMFLEHWVIHN